PVAAVLAALEQREARREVGALLDDRFALDQVRAVDAEQHVARAGGRDRILEARLGRRRHRRVLVDVAAALAVVVVVADQLAPREDHVLRDGDRAVRLLGEDRGRLHAHAIRLLPVRLALAARDHLLPDDARLRLLAVLAGADVDRGDPHTVTLRLVVALG